jgi:CPA2 family monovalent cation:H+ antiporter-2
VGDFHLIADLVLALCAAFAGGWIAQRLGLPVLLGYILAGVLIGPNTPGFVADRDRVETLANLGVAFLMFALGVEFSLGELRRVRRIAIVGGALQIPASIALGALVGRAIGWNIEASLLLGGAVSISSSIVALKLLMQRGEVASPQGRIALGLGVVQDLSLVPMIALLPLLSGDRGGIGNELVMSLGKAAIALAVVAVLGRWVVPRLLFLIARTESRELFLLAVVAIALGTAVASEEAGLSFALGAFLAGLVVSESEFDHQVLTEVIPLRDVFATLFFVGVGMLVDPGFLWDNWDAALVLVAALILGKLVIIGGSLLAAGVEHRVTTLAAVLMAQMGEFSFVLSQVGREEGIISDDQYSLILAGALGSIVAMPFVMTQAPKLVAIAAHLPRVARQEREAEGAAPNERLPGDHLVLLGHGRVGRVVGGSLAGTGISYTVIDANPATVRDLRSRGIWAFYGDGGSEVLLRRAGIERARWLVIATPDLVTAISATRHGKRLNPRLRVVARASAEREIDALIQAGADAVAQPEIEAGLELLRFIGFDTGKIAILPEPRERAHQLDDPSVEADLVIS